MNLGSYILITCVFIYNTGLEDIVIRLCTLTMYKHLSIKHNKNDTVIMNKTHKFQYNIQLLGSQLISTSILSLRTYIMLVPKLQKSIF